MKKIIIWFSILVLIIAAVAYLLIPDEKSVASFVGLKDSNLYHRFECSLLNDIKEEDKIWFDATITNEDSRYKGKQYFPCQVCILNIVQQ